MPKTVITYGTFDLFHYGHQALLEHAKELGDYLIVGITSDAFDKMRGKFDVKQPLVERIHAVEKTGLADKIIIEEFKGQKIEDIRKYHVDIFTVGSDWEGKFDYLKEYCDVVYLPRTQGVSSTSIRKEKSKRYSLGCIGINDFSNRIIRECNHVSEGGVTAICPSGNDPSGITVENEQISIVSGLDEMKDDIDAVYISGNPKQRAETVRCALEYGLHVLSEGPIAYSNREASLLQSLAVEKNLVLMEALSILYQPGFQRLKLLIESGIVGEIKDIDSSYSLVPDQIDYNDIYDSSTFRMSTRTLLPALVFLGPHFEQAQVICGYEKDYCTWAKYNLLYKTASATLKTGRGVKTEGSMVITGTDGYVYVPAPWWKLEYFEVRYEDLRDTRKHYYECVGEGQRYMLKQFFHYCDDGNVYSDARDELHNIELSVTQLIELANSADCLKLENNSLRFGGGETVNK